MREFFIWTFVILFLSGITLGYLPEKKADENPGKSLVVLVLSPFSVGYIIGKELQED